MKKTLSLMALFLLYLAIGQTKPIPEKILQVHKSAQVFQKVELFSLNLFQARAEFYSKAAKDISVLNLNEQGLKNLTLRKPQHIELSIPYNGREVIVELVQQKIFTEDFIAKDERGNKINYQPGVYYQGIVKGDQASLVAFSFFENDVVGVASSNELGNLTVAKSQNKRDFIAYSDRNLLGHNPFVCGVDELAENKGQELSFHSDMLSRRDMTTNCVRIYYELTNAIYQNNNSNTTEALNWITAIHNNISTLYTNDDIKTALSEVMIWTTDDPYDGGYVENLYEFAETRTVFNGDLGHLINYPSTTSVAFLNSLCSNYRYAYSGINMYFEQVPTYSWTIMAMTHEMGHSMGSPHTHSCVWNGNNTAIDGCGYWAGFSEGCKAPIADDGGTIMSYCHLIFGETNLANGFGPQPAALIRNTVDSRICLGTDCITSCSPTIEDISTLEISDNIYIFYIEDQLSEKWIYRIYEYGATPTEWTETQAMAVYADGLQPNKFYQFEAANTCGEGLNGGIKSILILTGNWCGLTFTDTGGIGGNYQDYQTLEKTFYPTAEDEKVKLTFTQFNLEQGYDFMYVYNGNSIEAPLFSNGNSLTGTTIPGPFTSTAEDGSITVRFVSDGGITAPGWTAQVSCARLSVEDIDANSGIAVYPNPTTSVLNIEAQEEIVSVRLNDVSGKQVISKKSTGLKEKLNIEHLPKGVYILVVEMKGETFTKKIIKN